MSSFWDSIKRGLDSAVDSVNQVYSEMTSYPERIQCINEHCLKYNNVPVSTFNWVCINGHDNTAVDTTCSACQTTKKDAAKVDLYHPQITCEYCQTVLDVAETRIGGQFKESVYTAPAYANKLIDNTKQYIKDNRHIETFPCEHCGVELYAPSGPWVCVYQGCGQFNQDGSEECHTCKQHRYISGVTCAVCNRTTSVPGFKAVAQLDGLFNSLVRATQERYHFFKGSVYCECKRCKHPQALSKEEARIVFGLSADALVPGFDEIPEGKKQQGGTTTTPTTSNNQDFVDALNSIDSQNGHVEPQTIDIVCTQCTQPFPVSLDDLHCRSSDAAKHVQRAQQKKDNTTTSTGATDGTTTTTADTTTEPSAPSVSDLSSSNITTTTHVDSQGRTVPFYYTQEDIAARQKILDSPCTKCSTASTRLNRITTCYSCQQGYCRQCAPYYRQISIYQGSRVMFCFECAQAHDVELKQQRDDQAAIDADIALKREEQLAAEAAAQATVTDEINLGTMSEQVE